MKNLKLFSLLIIGLVVLPSCKREAVRVKFMTSSVTEIGNVTVRVNELSTSETKALFKGRGRYLAKGDDGIIPLRVIVENNTNQTVIVKPAMMAITDTHTIYKKIEKNVAGIAIASAVGGALLAGDLGALAFGAGFGISNAKKNDKILGKISHDAFVGPREVYPGSVLNKIMFVPKHEMQSSFVLPVGNQMHRIQLA